MPNPLWVDARDYLTSQGQGVTTANLNQAMNLLASNPALRPSYAKASSDPATSIAAGLGAPTDQLPNAPITDTAYMGLMERRAGLGGSAPGTATTSSAWDNLIPSGGTTGQVQAAMADQPIKATPLPGSVSYQRPTSYSPPTTQAAPKPSGPKAKPVPTEQIAATRQAHGPTVGNKPNPPQPPQGDTVTQPTPNSGSPPDISGTPGYTPPGTTPLGKENPTWQPAQNITQQALTQAQTDNILPSGSYDPSLTGVPGPTSTTNDYSPLTSGQMAAGAAVAAPVVTALLANVLSRGRAGGRAIAPRIPGVTMPPTGGAASAGSALDRVMAGGYRPTGSPPPVSGPKPVSGPAPVSGPRPITPPAPVYPGPLPGQRVGSAGPLPYIGSPPPVVPPAPIRPIMARGSPPPVAPLTGSLAAQKAFENLLLAALSRGGRV